MIKEYSNSELTHYLSSAINCLNAAKGVTGFVLNHNYKEIFSKVQPYLELRNGVIAKYGEQDEDGEFIIVDEEQREKANKELADYAELKVSVDIVKIPEEKTMDSNLTAAQLMSLTWMIKPMSSDAIRSILGIDDEEEDAKPAATKYDPRDPVDDPRFT